MKQKNNVVFLGCNYSNMKVKRLFDRLKVDWQSKYPLRVELIDKQPAPGAVDKWQQITRAIDEASLVVLDVSAFKPNVVLELGYALATKPYDQIVITFDERKPRTGQAPKWMLSDIPHLNEVRYKRVPVLRAALDEHLVKVPSAERFAEVRAAAGEDQAGNAISAAILEACREMIKRGSLAGQQLAALAVTHRADPIAVQRLLREKKLAKKQRGPGDRWIPVDEV